MRVMFGKFKGKEVNSLPRSYLRWLRESGILQGDLRIAVEMALDYGVDINPKPRNLDDEVDRVCGSWEDSSEGQQRPQQAAGDTETV